MSSDQHHQKMMKYASLALVTGVIGLFVMIAFGAAETFVSPYSETRRMLHALSNCGVVISLSALLAVLVAVVLSACGNKT